MKPMESTPIVRSSTSVHDPRAWRLLAVAAAVCFTIPLAYWHYQTEFPYVDGLRTFDHVVRRPWGGLWADVFSGTEEFRPLYFALVKLVHDAVGGPSLLAFRTINLAFIVFTLTLYAALMRVDRANSVFGFVLALGCFAGLHTVTDNLTAPQPLPYGPIVIALLLGTLLLLRRPPSLARDLAAGVLSLVAVFLVEYGVTVGVVWIVAGIARFGGARGRTALLGAAGVGIYVLVRLLTNTHSVPGPFYTETGLFFRENVPVSEQRAIFGGREWLFHAYNVWATFSTVLFSEPRAGVYRAVDALWNATPVKPWQVVHWVTSLGATSLVVIWLAHWKHRTRDEKAVIILATLAIAIVCMMGYLYTRDRIPVLAGAAYALLAGLAAAAMWQRRAGIASRPRRYALTAALVVLAAGWSLRLAGTVVWARDQAWAVRDEWTDRYERLRPPDSPPDDPRTEALRQELRRRSLSRPLPDPRQDPEWMRRWFERKNF